MISAWSRRRGSERRRRTPWLPAVALLLLAAAGAAVARTPGLRLAAGAPDRYADLLRRDTAWLATLPDSLPLAAGDPDSAWTARLLAPPGEGRPHRVRSVASLLRERWQRRGFLACRVAVAPDGDGGRDLVVSPGPAYRLGNVRLLGGTAAARKRWRRWLPPAGTPFRADAFAAAVGRLLAALGDAGHPFARWLVREAAVRRNPPRLDLAAEILPGPRAVLGPQRVSLPSPRARRFVARATGLRAGEPFRQSRLAEARRRLLRRDLYAAVDSPLVFTTASPETVGIWWPVRPRRHANRLSVVLGWQRGGDGGGGRLSGQVRLLLPNLAQTGRRLDLAWSDDGQRRSRFGVSWLEPLVAGTPLDLSLSVAHEVQRDVYTSFQTSAEVTLPVHGGWDVAAGAGWDRGTFPTGPWRRTGRWRTWAGLLHRRLDRRRSGWSARLAVAAASRSATPRDSTAAETAGAKAAADSVTVGLVGGDQRQTLLTADVRGEWFLAPAVSLAGRLLWRSQESDRPGAPLTEQYRLGGAATLRGYREDAFHGERVGLLSLEARLGPPDRSRVYAFLDLGYVRLYREGEGQVVSRPRGFGLGLWTRAAAGTVALAVGFPGTVRFDDAKLHVTLLQGF